MGAARSIKADSAGLAALGDPTRRAVFEMLQGEGASVGELAAALPVSRPAVSQHLKVLKDAGLVREHRSGRHRIYRVDLKGLGDAKRYLERLWETALASLEEQARTDRGAR